MAINLQGKSVLLGITGSISAYKACEVARLFVKAGASVHVVMTPAAQRFVSPLTFEALTRNPVLTQESESWSSELNHIDIGKKCDIFLIAPATANTLNKLAKGIADNILLQTALAFGKPILVAPAANTQMLANHYTTGSLKMLKVNDYTIIQPQTKELACKDVGNGALAEPLEIFYQGAKALMQDPFWQDRRVVVTGGGTREKIDEVRYLSNYSSGKMANALATALYLKGADVCLITTMPHNDLSQDVYTIDVESAQEMFEYTTDAIRVAKKGVMRQASMNSNEAPGMIQKIPYLFMAAAVADFTPAYPQSGKLKKSAIGEKWALELKQTPDILASLNKDGIKTVAFKAEMDAQNGEKNAKALLEQKGADAVCYNLLQNSQSFGTDRHAVSFITPTDTIPLPQAPKVALALNILDQAKELADD